MGESAFGDVFPRATRVTKCVPQKQDHCFEVGINVGLRTQQNVFQIRNTNHIRLLWLCASCVL